MKEKGRIPARVRGCACFVRLLFRGPATAKGLVELLGFELLLEVLADEHGEQPANIAAPSSRLGSQPGTASQPRHRLTAKIASALSPAHATVRPKNTPPV